MKKSKKTLVGQLIETTDINQMVDLLKAGCFSVDHVKNGYKSNTGRGRCIRKNGSFDYIKMSELYHAGEW